MTTKKTTTKKTRHGASNIAREGRYVWHDAKTGKSRGVEIVRPAKGPSHTSLAEIRRAIDMLNDGNKTKP